MLFKLALFACFNICLIKSIQGLDSCGTNWTAYKDIKCLKILNRKVTEEEAVKNCTDLGSLSTLVTIHSQEEQDFLKRLLSAAGISSDVWIGLHYSNASFNWLDGENSSYENWDQDAVRDGSLPCVHLKPGTGKWSDESCKKPAAVVCQQKQIFDVSLLKSAIEKMGKKIKDLEERTQNKLNSIKASALPIGFIYIQLPNQAEPNNLWPSSVFYDVTPDYAGLFFRAEGGESMQFGKIQPANSSRISNIETLSGRFESWKIPVWSQRTNNQIDQGQWSGELIKETSQALYSLSIYTTGGENRPKNTAIKIWKKAN